MYNAVKNRKYKDELISWWHMKIYQVIFYVLSLDISAYFIKILFEGFNSEFNFLPSESLLLSSEL